MEPISTKRLNDTFLSGDLELNWLNKNENEVYKSPRDTTILAISTA